MDPVKSVVHSSKIIPILLISLLVTFSFFSNPSVYNNSDGIYQPVFAASPDWIVENLYLTNSNLQPTYKTNFEAVIKNAGDAETNPSHVTYYVNGAIFDEQAIGDRNAGSFSRERSKLWEYPGGTFTIMVCVDRHNTTPESNESNNCKSIIVGAPAEKISTTLELSVCPSTGSGYDCTTSSVQQNTNIQVKIQGMLKKGGSQDGISGRIVTLSWPGGSTSVTTSSYGGYEYTTTVYLSSSGTFTASFAGDATYKSSSASKTLGASAPPPPPPPPPPEPEPTPVTPPTPQEVKIRLRSDADDGRTDIGSIVFDGRTYSLPTTIYKPAGTYSIQASPAKDYVFKQWDSISPVSSRASPSTTVTVSGTSVIVEMELRSEPEIGSFHFALSASPTYKTIEQGHRTTISVPVTHTSGPSERVSLSLSGLPSAVGTYYFSPSYGTSSFTSTLYLDVKSSASLGTYSLMIKASGGGETHQRSVNLKIISAEQDYPPPIEEDDSDFDSSTSIPDTPASTSFGKIVVEKESYTLKRHDSEQVNIIGSIENYQRGKYVEIILTKPGGETESMSFLPTKDGVVRGYYRLVYEAEAGTYSISATYNGQNIGSDSFEVKKSDISDQDSSYQETDPKFDISIEKILLNRNPPITTKNGLYLSKPPGQAEAKIVSFGVWSQLSVTNNSPSTFEGFLRGYMVSQSGYETEYMGVSGSPYPAQRVPVKVEGNSKAKVDVPIFSNNPNFNNQKLSIRLDLGYYDSFLKTDSNWHVVDTTTFPLTIVGKITGPQHVGIRIPITEVLDFNADFKDIALGWADFVFMLAQAKGAGYVTSSGVSPGKAVSLSEMFPSVTISDARIISEIFSRSTYMRLDKEQLDNDLYSFTLSNEVIRLPLSNYQFWFSNSFDRVYTIVKLPKGLSIQNHDGLDTLTDQNGNTLIIWIDNYVDKLFNDSVRTSHEFIVEKNGIEEYKIESVSYYELGPFERKPSKNIFNIINYDKWINNPESVYWLTASLDNYELILDAEKRSSNLESSFLGEQSMSTLVEKERKPIPGWFKSNVKWWSEDVTSDNEFVSSIEYLIKMDVISIKKKTQTQTSTTTERDIPSWIKNNAKLWQHGTISDEEFLNGIEWLVNQNIIGIN